MKLFAGNSEIAEDFTAAGSRAAGRVDFAILLDQCKISVWGVSKCRIDLLAR